MKSVGKIIFFVVAALLAVAVVCYLLYEIIVLNKFDSSSLFKALLILASLAVSVFKVVTGTNARKVSVKVYRDSYRDIIGDAFANDSKRENTFFTAVNFYQTNAYSKALKFLDKSETESQNSNERFAVYFFKALCYTDIGVYTEAISYYEKALFLKEHTTAYLNIGFCQKSLGKLDLAIEAYQNAIKIAPDNANAYNNISAAYIDKGEYEIALEYAEKALSYNAKLHPAHSAKAICFAVLGEREKCKEAFRLAVLSGANKESLLNILKTLDIEF
ncbi:MAG: tetratricopeptide repeat protein [Ruminococcaceae bacterium]|nr:tetratricopeptide repeat protein [Oscillospiraceae bacterium]